MGTFPAPVPDPDKVIPAIICYYCISVSWHRATRGHDVFERTAKAWRKSKQAENPGDPGRVYPIPWPLTICQSEKVKGRLFSFV